MSSAAGMMKVNPADIIITVRDRPIPKDPLHFFNFKSSSRIFVNITDSTSVWQTDLILAERLFADMIICPFQIEDAKQTAALQITKDILKQRMKYPGVKENPEHELIAKTWVLPSKVHSGPSASTFFEPGDKTIHTILEPVFETLKNTDNVIHLLKIEVTHGVERQFIYRFLDSGFRPSIILVKWSNDLDEDYATAHCGGHIVNSGYSLLALENGYALYIFSEQTLYDICSMKTIGMQNPIMASIVQSITLQTQTQTQPQNIDDKMPITTESVNE